MFAGRSDPAAASLIGTWISAFPAFPSATGASVATGIRVLALAAPIAVVVVVSECSPSVHLIVPRPGFPLRIEHLANHAVWQDDLTAIWCHGAHASFGPTHGPPCDFLQTMWRKRPSKLVRRHELIL